MTNSPELNTIIAMELPEEEKRLEEARKLFSEAFGNIENAVIEKSQRNGFAVNFKYPLAIAGTFVMIAFFIAVIVICQIFEPFFIVCTIILSIGLLAVDILLALTWIRTRKNAVLCETIRYCRKKDVTIVTEVDGTGTKAEWPGVSLFFDIHENAEIVESPDVPYNPFPVKNMRGHSRNCRLLNPDFILKAFFNGCDAEIVDGAVSLTSGFSFKTAHGILTEISIEGNYQECYENNFPLYAILVNSSRYIFTYKFTAVNDPSFIQRFPKGTREIATMFRMPLPDEDGIIIPDEGGKNYC